MWLYNISDIEIIRGEVIVKKPLTYTSAALEKELSLTKYNADYIFKHTEADRVFIPSMAIPFYYFIFLHGRIPKEREFYDIYMTLYSGGWRITKEDYSYLEDLYVKEIIHRSYPSFVRDFHFYLLLNEDPFFDTVWYSVRSDVADGIDIYVEKAGELYTIGLFLESAKSRKYLEQKMSSVHIPISVEFNKDSANQFGKFSLCGADHVEMVKTAVSLPLSKW